MTTVYLDVLIAVNWLIDDLLLSGCARLLHLPYRRGRLVLGSLFGGCCACVILLPPLPVYLSLAVKLVTAGIMALIGFPWLGVRAYLRQTGLLFLLSALFAGMAMAVWTLVAPTGFYVANGVVYYAISPLWLAVLCGVCYGLICLYDRLFRQEGKAGVYRLTVADQSGTVTLRALYDSGNELCDAFSGSPVIVVQREAVLNVLPPPLRRTLAAAESDDTAAAETAMEAGWRLIPFHSLGGNGLLPAFRPRELSVCRGDGKPVCITGCFVALSPALGRGPYQALIGRAPLALTEKGGQYETVTL